VICFKKSLYTVNVRRDFSFMDRYFAAVICLCGIINYTASKKIHRKGFEPI